MSLIGYEGQIELDEDDWLDEQPNDDDDDWTCQFGEKCLHPSYNHHRDECYTLEYAQEWEPPPIDNQNYQA